MDTDLDRSPNADGRPGGDSDSDKSDSSDDDLDSNANGSSNRYVDMSINMNNEEHGHILTGPEVRQLRQESLMDPTIVVYPGNRAGEVCSKGIMVMQEYENTIGGPSENPYSPFRSEIDWELAKWAKLRGPSATSFTELLNISGVSTINKAPSSIVSLFLSSCTNN